MQGQELLYKRVLDISTVQRTLREVEIGNSTRIDAGFLACSRLRTEEGALSEELREEIRGQIRSSIGAYFGGFVELGDLRVWRQDFGEVKPHLDVCSSAACAGLSHVHTLLIYLTDDFEGGELSVKCPRRSNDLDPEPEKRHRVFRFEPRIGFGILFSKRFLHWADMVCGCKQILLCDVASPFSLLD